MSVAELVRSGQSIEAVARAFDALDHTGRLAQMYELTHADQEKLFTLAAGRACSIAGDFIPAGKQPLQEVIHWGINSLPVFRKFQKRFTAPRTPGAAPIALGYNEQTMKTFTGPGFFVAREAASESGVKTVVVDYTLLPDHKPDAWPTILPNTARLSRFVYNGTNDWMWKVSANVTVGRARRESGWMPNWFVLCRED